MIPITLNDVLQELQTLKRISHKLTCGCILVPIRDGHGERMVCPQDCPHGELDEHIAHAMVFTEILLKQNNK